MNSMTGFGTAEVHGDRGSVRVSIKSVNHKGLDIRIRGLGEIPEAEADMKNILRRHIKRGHVEVQYRCERVAGDALTFDEGAFEAYRNLLHKTGATKEGDDVDVYWILDKPGVVQTEFDASDTFLEKEFEEAAALAIADLVSMRRAEGANVFREIKADLGRLKGIVEEMERESEAEKEIRRVAFEERVRAFMREFEADPARFSTELALLYDKMSVEEEITRLYSHIDQFDDIMNGNGPVGRKLDFLLQEMHREANTISSKSKSVAVLHDIVEVKSLIEDMREQIANIE
ncbi:Domain of uncharacterised function (DUF1732) [Aedoeadaptatus ivorii]|uniref:Domain of uncharacterized function (DUF1732) n=1 Tax=Aedoeadaptatus ivorii TaxID=54006 RepID=A0A3S4YPF2_9FIRM|nr:YicC/YloC family endoribonuclease [Peptoniphilus ivorii]MDQ0507774.1 uncharacterized protein (TIGR00255 family) [Peptoniphilus ivorii]VEJ35584.1 Domain of uncharacterised function (DUF1732) [Peptoniphilus ivorii]